MTVPYDTHKRNLLLTSVDRCNYRINALVFFQGDREIELGLPISPLCDRSVTCIPESQLGTQCMQNHFQCDCLIVDMDRRFIMWSFFFYKTSEACLHQATILDKTLN